MMKLLTILGARPQFIKGAVISRATSGRDDVREVIVHTGQHYDKNMSDVFFSDMGIPKPDYMLDIHGLGHGAMTGRMLEGIEEIILKEKPHWVLVYGDTNSTLAGALAAAKLHVPVAHVEAGLRSHNMAMPEEVNRILTDRVSKTLFAPTDNALANLKREGFDHFDCRVVRTGDVMYDAALYYKDKARRPFDVPASYVLATIHRQENTDEPERLKNIFAALNEIADETAVVLPLHPRTRNILKSRGDIHVNDNLHIHEPVGYLEIVYLLQHARLVMTDSGGMQKEAYFFGKPCITLREETEWTELVESGANRLAGATHTQIRAAYRDSISGKVQFEPGLYGDGHSGEGIVNELLA